MILPLGSKAWRLQVLCGLGLLVLYVCQTVTAADLAEVEQLFLHGKYQQCIEQAGTAIDNHLWNERWRQLMILAQLRTGRYQEALRAAETALTEFPSSIEIRRLSYRACLFNGQSKKAAEILDGLDALRAQYGSWRYNDARSLVSWGRMLQLRKADPKEILEQYFNGAKKSDSGYIEAYIASAELALEKQDAALAAEYLAPAIKLEPEHPELNYLLAQAFVSSDPERADAALKRALAANPRHVGCLLLVVENLIDAERFDDARKGIKEVLAINPRQWQALAYFAVLAHLDGNSKDESFWRAKALADWTDNPGVDHLIGRKLSRQYRFAEGAAYQRRALAMRADYVPARLQLAEDLLRLGQEQQGWELAEAVNRDDPYLVVAHNLMTLHDNLARFRTLRADGLVVRMESGEADIYGRQVLALLATARQTLTARYQVTLPDPIHVEIFPQQADFAIRTFGLPGGAGFLGVCFGNVITANSPASQGENPANWHSVLWHEFCHVVTLHKTQNRMPRWLSEGISVYEERRRNAAWGQSMTAAYRQLILAGKATPVSRLSSAFLSPPSPVHLEFAYYESSLVVEFLVDRYGFHTLVKILNDLAAGTTINESLARHTHELATLDTEFHDFLVARANQLAPQADWTRIELTSDPGGGGAGAAQLELVEKALQDHPQNIGLLKRFAGLLLERRDYARAIAPAKKLQEVYPEDVGPDCAYRILARCYRELHDTRRERAVLERLVTRDADASVELARLLEICTQTEDWPALAQYAQQVLAINPLTPLPHRSLALAAGHLHNPALEVQAYSSLVSMNPVDPAETHWRLGRALLEQREYDTAKRQVLQAIEAAPRFQAAHQTLLEIVDRAPTRAAAPAETAPPEAAPPEAAPPADKRAGDVKPQITADKRSPVQGIGRNQLNNPG